MTDDYTRMANDHPILSDLRVMRENDQPVEMLNIYKGVPFVCSGRILEIGEDQAVIRADSAELVCLQNDGFTCLLGNDYFEPVSARVKAVDAQAGTVTLDGFAYLGARLGARMALRVEPVAPLPVLVHTRERPLLGQMIDLSMNGMGVRISGDAVPAGLAAGDRVFITTTLPGGEIALNGALLNAVITGGSVRLSIRFNPDHDYKAIIFHFLVDRRSQIETEMRGEFEHMRTQSDRD